MNPKVARVRIDLAITRIMIAIKGQIDQASKNGDMSGLIEKLTPLFERLGMMNNKDPNVDIMVKAETLAEVFEIIAGVDMPHELDYLHVFDPRRHEEYEKVVEPVQSVNPEEQAIATPKKSKSRRKSKKNEAPPTSLEKLVEEISV